MGVGRKTRDVLWGKAAGHCEICAAPLDEGLYRMSGNHSNIAHIKAQSPEGPRFDPVQSDSERHGIGNLMLLCPTCHKSIDDNEKDFPVEKLLGMKACYEEAIAQFASTRVIPKVDVISFLYPISGQRMELREVEWKAALLDSGMAYTGMRPFSVDGGQVYDGSLSAAAEHMERQFAIWEATFGDRGNPVAVFAMAPQALLIKLGNLIGDKRAVNIFQRHRKDSPWSWCREGSLPTVRFDAPEGDFDAKDVNLIVSMSGKVNPKSLPDDTWSFPTAVLGTEAPGVDVASLAESLDLFAHAFISAVSEIHASFPSLEKLHLYPAMPVSMAVKLGTAMNMNLLKRVVIYEKRDSRFHATLEIGG